MCPGEDRGQMAFNLNLSARQQARLLEQVLGESTQKRFQRRNLKNGVYGEQEPAKPGRSYKPRWMKERQPGRRKLRLGDYRK